MTHPRLLSGAECRCILGGCAPDAYRCSRGSSGSDGGRCLKARVCSALTIIVCDGPDPACTCVHFGAGRGEGRLMVARVHARVRYCRWWSVTVTFYGALAFTRMQHVRCAICGAGGRRRPTARAPEPTLVCQCPVDRPRPPTWSAVMAQSWRVRGVLSGRGARRYAYAILISVSARSGQCKCKSL